MTWQIIINQDKTEVLLDLRHKVSGESVVLESLLTALQEQNIPVNDELTQKLQQALPIFNDPSRANKLPVLAKATLPIPGEKGSFVWSDSLNPQKRHPPTGNASEGQEHTSFYEWSRLPLVKAEEVLGTLHPNVAGKPGVNVCGEPMEPEPVEEFRLEAGTNVRITPNGMNFIAQCDGQVKLDKGVLSVDPILRINTDVDFETGNIHYAHDVMVKGDIKDLFTVETGGDLTVEGTIEGANIKCAGQLMAKRGIAGKEKGLIEVKGKVIARYLSNTVVWAETDVAVETEIVNAEVHARGNLTLQKGAIHGGHITVGGIVEVPVLGSSMGVSTFVRVGADPFLLKDYEELKTKKKFVMRKLAVYQPQFVILSQTRSRINQQVRELAEEIKRLEEETIMLDQKIQMMEDQVAKSNKGVVVVQKTLHPGVKIQIGKAFDIIKSPMTGPLKVKAYNDNGVAKLDFSSNR